MVAAMALEDEPIDDISVGLQMQQFLDEWNYRVIHANMACKWDQVQTTLTALSLFEAHGLVISEEEKMCLVEMEESKMVEALVQKMSPALRRTFEHFTLQLQLFVSATTRVRQALDDGDNNDVRRIVEDGDRAITQQILKQTVVEAGAEIAEIRGVHDSWSYSMTKRIDRLSRTAESTEQARSELERVSKMIEEFGRSQNEKSHKVLASMAEGNDSMLLKVALGGWHTYFQKYKSEKDIHAKFRLEIENAKKALIEYQAAKIENVRKVMLQTCENNQQAMLTEVCKQWHQAVKDEKEEREAARLLEEQVAKMASMKESQKENARQAMMRMCSGSDEALAGLTFQAWMQVTEEDRMQHQFDQEAADLEAKLKAMKAQKGNDGKSVLARFSTANDTGLTSTVFRSWGDHTRQELKAKRAKEALDAADSRLKCLRDTQKYKALSAAEKVAILEDEIPLLTCFMNWQMETTLSRVNRHYRQQMEDKKGQLDFVKGLFKDFAKDLELAGDLETKQQTKSVPGKEPREKPTAALPSS